MTPISNASRGLLLALVLAGAAACGERHSDGAPNSANASPSAVVIGVAPAEPSGNSAATTPVGAGTTEVSKTVESMAMPLPGQANDHSNLARAPSQKAESAAVLKSPAAAKAANSEAPTERTYR